METMHPPSSNSIWISEQNRQLQAANLQSGAGRGSRRRSSRQSTNPGGYIMSSNIDIGLGIICRKERGAVLT